MKRPWQVWLIYSLCLVVVLPGMAWLTLQALELDRAEAQARLDAELEREISQALWNMDTELAPVIGREIARPYFVYRSFYEEQQLSGQWAKVPSPLLTKPLGCVHLHFQSDSSGQWISPQVPAEVERPLAILYCPSEVLTDNESQLASLSQALNADELLELLPDEMLPNIDPLLYYNDGELGELVFNTNANVYGIPGQGAPWSSPAATERYLLENSRNPDKGEGANNEELLDSAQRDRFVEDGRNFERRNDNYQAYTQQLVLQERAGNRGQYSFDQTEQAPSEGDGQTTPPVQSAEGAQQPSPLIPEVAEGITLPVWIGDRLLLARRVNIDGEVVIQGCWLNWPLIQELLEKQLPERLQGAEFQPVLPDDPVPHPSRTLAALPVMLLVPRVAPTVDGRSPLQMALMVAWACLIVGALAVAALLSGVITLSERRGAFVSAVTHELRTPLTTFRMYAEMLAEGMVPEGKKRHQYLETLRKEADRLSHLVENVLSYARLERGKKSGQRRSISVSDLLQRSRSRLQDRAEQAEMNMQFVDTEEHCSLLVLTDAAAIDQILMNLVDNACKYASAAEDRTIRISVEQNAQAVHFVVRDFGPGIADSVKHRLFRPFSKSVEEAAVTAPGIGLGLALCKRLTKDLSAKLVLEPSPTGACFRLSLPRSQQK